MLELFLLILPGGLTGFFCQLGIRIPVSQVLRSGGGARSLGYTR